MLQDFQRQGEGHQGSAPEKLCLVHGVPWIEDEEEDVEVGVNEEDGNEPEEGGEEEGEEENKEEEEEDEEDEDEYEEHIQ